LAALPEQPAANSIAARQNVVRFIPGGFARGAPRVLGTRQGLPGGGADGGPVRRFFAFPLIRLVLVFAAFAAGMLAFASIARTTGLPRSFAVSEWVTLGVLLAAIFIVEHFTVARGPREIGFDPRHALRDTLLGLATGAALFSTVVAELALARAYRIDALHPSLAVLQPLLWLVPGAAAEEVLFRGAIFRRRGFRASPSRLKRASCSPRRSW
jgi:membrane protease YdiL (CAAX protease family)